MADEDYRSALEYATIEQKLIYESEAKTIDSIQKGILEISQKEEPFDDNTDYQKACRFSREIAEELKTANEFIQKNYRQKIIDELKTLIGDGKSKLGDEDWFWSSSTSADDADDAWIVIFYYGVVFYGDKSSGNFYVRCVR